MPIDKTSLAVIILFFIITPLALLFLGIGAGLDYKTLVAAIISAAIGAAYAIGLDRLIQRRRS